MRAARQKPKRPASGASYHSQPVSFSIRSASSLGRMSRAWAIFRTASKFACFAPVSIMERCVRAIPAKPLRTSGKWGMTEPNILDFLKGAQKYIAADTFDRAAML